jgi:hypothetical protein
VSTPPDHVDLLGGCARERVSCNHHDDCEAADEQSRAERGKRAFHCWIDDCEDCYGC